MLLGGAGCRWMEQKAVMDVEGVIEASNIRARRMGPQMLVDLLIRIDCQLSASAAQQVAEQVRPRQTDGGGPFSMRRKWALAHAVTLLRRCGAGAVAHPACAPSGERGAGAHQDGAHALPRGQRAPTALRDRERHQGHGAHWRRHDGRVIIS